MVIDHARRLHEGVANRRPDEGESSGLQVRAQGVRFAGARGNLPQTLPSVGPGSALNEPPEVGIEAAELLPNGQDRPRVPNRGGDLEPISHDPGIGEQPSDIP